MQQRPTELIVFGDSLSDVGNAHAILGDEAVPCPPHWRGRRCNGCLWVERLAALLGLPAPRPSIQGGTVHAYGGALSGLGVSPTKGVPNLLRQVEAFLVSLGNAPADPGALYVLRAGANDYLGQPWPLGPACGEAINANLLAAVDALAIAGAELFLVPSELPWGFSPIVPASLTSQDRLDLNRLIQLQNGNLRERLEALADQRGLRIVQPDLHGLLTDIVAAPADFGFQEVWRPALPGDPGAKGCLWWDDRAHLTTAVHNLMAERAFQMFS